MTKTEIMEIINNPTKHIQILNRDGKASIVYSSKFVELLELIPTMLTKADMMDILDKIRAEINAESAKSFQYPNWERAKALEWALEIIDKYSDVS